LEWNEWQFIVPVYIGDHILAKITIKDLRVTSNSARGVFRLMFEVINQNDEVVQKGCNHLLVQIWFRLICKPRSYLQYNSFSTSIE
jgi:acyl dehydratase